MAKEQRQMHDRMLTPNGHQLIEVARCCIRKNGDIYKVFPHIHADVGPIMENLDPHIISLIAETPILNV